MDRTKRQRGSPTKVDSSGIKNIYVFILVFNRFLVNHALTDLKKIFANGLDASLFGHFASLFSAEIDESEDKTSAATHAVGVLEGLARMERFDWTLSFLGSRERSRLTTFMDKASQAGASVDTFRVHARL